MKKPGSIDAINDGCTCPDIDNRYGAGAYGEYYWISSDCPLHGELNENNEYCIIPFKPKKSQNDAE